MTVLTSKITFAVGFAIYIAIRGVFIERTKANTIESKVAGLGDRVLFFVMFVGGLIIPVLYLISPLFSFADYTPPAAMNWCGLLVMMTSLWLFWRAHVDLGKNWSATLELRQGHELIRAGVYRGIRHPMYLAIFLFSVAQGLLLPNWLAGWSAIAAFLPMYVFRVAAEEQMLCTRFGDSYRQYMAETGRLLPKFRGKR